MRFLFFIFIILSVFIKNTFAQDSVFISNGNLKEYKTFKISTNEHMIIRKINNQKRSFTFGTNQPQNIFKQNEDLKKVRLSFQGGLSYWLGKIDNELPEDIIKYTEDLRYGYNYAGEIGFFPIEKFGIGFKFSDFRTKNEKDNIAFTSITTGKSDTGKMSDNISIRYFGFVFKYMKMQLDNKTLFLADFSLGYLSYKNEAILKYELTLRGQSIGIHGGLGFDRMISNDVALGVGVHFTFGSLTRYELETGGITKTIGLEIDKQSSLSHLDLSIGLRLFPKKYSELKR